MIKLEDYDYRLLTRISNKIGIKVDIKEIDNEFYIKSEDLFSIMDELYDNTSYLEEKLQDLEQDIQEHYEFKKINPYEYYGVSREEFV